MISRGCILQFNTRQDTHKLSCLSVYKQQHHAIQWSDLYLDSILFVFLLTLHRYFGFLYPDCQSLTSSEKINVLFWHMKAYQKLVFCESFFNQGLIQVFGKLPFLEKLGKSGGVIALQRDETRPFPKLNFKLIIYELSVQKMPTQFKCYNNLQI